ncbi:MAG: hypothetical protein ACFCU8_05325 [Thermosynechococcaceae cyanobacterium]
MRLFSPQHPAGKGWAALLFTTLLCAPALAESSNFGSISFAPGAKAGLTMKGYAKGVVALHKVVGNRDRNNNLCMGYGSPEPDHILVLKGNAAQLTLQVNSGKDTTLLVKGPDNKLYCADATARGKDASLVTQSLKSGSYRIWVGTSNPGQSYRYTLNVTD